MTHSEGTQAHYHHAHTGHFHGTPTGKLIAAAFWINFVFMIIEAAGGWITGSLALIADAGHMLNDVLSLGLTWATWSLASRAAYGGFTFGFRRAQVLAALADAVGLGAIMVFILIEAVKRLYAPQEVLAGGMLAIALAGLAANFVSGGLLFFRRDENMNIRGAFYHLMADALGSVAAVAAAIIIYFTSWFWVDPVLSILISMLVAIGAWRLMRESLSVLMEKAPPGFNPDQTIAALKEIEGVENVHDLHVWQLDDGKPLASAHVTLSAEAFPRQREILERCRKLFRQDLGISHATIQIEGHDWSQDCDTNCAGESDQH